jgi:hypothetical protein
MVLPMASPPAQHPEASRSLRGALPGAWTPRTSEVKKNGKNDIITIVIIIVY